MNTEDWEMSPQGKARVRELLQPGEELLLVVKPATGLNVAAATGDWVTGAVLLGCVGGICWLWWGAIVDIWWYYMLASSPFLVMGTAIIYSPLLKRWRVGHTLYLLTNRRVVMSIPRLFARDSVREFALNPNPVKRVRYADDDSGDIVFAYDTPRVFGLRRKPLPVGFLSVPQVERVAQLIARQVVAQGGARTEDEVLPPTDFSQYPQLLPESRSVWLLFGVMVTLFSVALAVFGGYQLLNLLKEGDWHLPFFALLSLLSAMVGIYIGGGMLADSLKRPKE